MNTITPPTRSKRSHLSCLSSLVCGLTLISLSPRASATDHFVATDGSDNNSGTTITAPLATLTMAIRQAAPGDTIYLRGGTYREEVSGSQGGGTAQAPITITAYPNESPVIKASDLVTGWERYQGNIWKKSAWNINSQQLFHNGLPLQQIAGIRPDYTQSVYIPIGSSVTDMVAGSFHYEWNTGTLYAWLPDNSDPNTSVMEASTKAHALKLTIPYVNVKGITFRHCNYTQWYFSPSQAAVVHMGANSTIENCDIQWGDFGGLLLQTNASAINCTISNNGAVGVGCVRVNQQSVFDITVKGCLIQHNNYRGISQTFHTGGIKLIPDINGKIEDNEISDNNGPGIWIDWDRSGRPITINNNRVRNNARVGIMVEGSENTLIYNNLITATRGIGVYISGSNNTRCYHNTIVGSTGYAGILMGGVPRLDCTLKNNAVFNNILFDSSGAVDFYIPAENGVDVSGNTSDYNCIFHQGGTLAMCYGGQTCTNLTSWRLLSGLDLHSINANPAFNLADTDDFSVPTNSPVVDAGINLAEITFDLRGIPRPQGNGWDIGAFETSQQDTSPPTQPTGLTSSRNDATHFLVKWTPSNDNVGVVGYDIYLNGAYFCTTTAPEVLIGPLEYAMTYELFVMAVDGAGLKSTMSQPLELNLGAPPDAIAPSIPMKPKAVVKSATAIHLSWPAATDNVGVKSYHVFRNGVRIATTTATWFTDSLLSPGTTYIYQISAIDAAGNQSGLSKSTKVTTFKKLDHPCTGDKGNDQSNHDQDGDDREDDDHC